MALASKEEWLEWVKHPVTEEFLEHINDVINSTTWDLVSNAGLNPTQDRWNSATITTLGGLLEWRPAIVVEEEVKAASSQEDIE